MLYFQKSRKSFVSKVILRLISSRSRVHVSYSSKLLCSKINLKVNEIRGSPLKILHFKTNTFWNFDLKITPDSQPRVYKYRYQLLSLCTFVTDTLCFEIPDYGSAKLQWWQSCQIFLGSGVLCGQIWNSVTLWDIYLLWLHSNLDHIQRLKIWVGETSVQCFRDRGPYVPLKDSRLQNIKMSLFEVRSES